MNVRKRERASASSLKRYHVTEATIDAHDAHYPCSVSTVRPCDLIAPRAKPVLLQQTRRAFTAENRKKQCQRSAAITKCTSVFCTESMCLPYTWPLPGQVLNHHVLGLHKISKTEKEVQELEDAIKKGDVAALQALGYDSREEAKAALVRLEERSNELLKKENLLRQEQQQQSGAGTSMLPVRREAVLSLVEVVITLIKLKPKRREEEVSFDQPPTLQHINTSVENLFDECKREDFEL
eukprot:3142-Heterococcus_DN1.PRE.1